MALTKQVRAVGSHAWYFRAGDAYTVPGAGTAAQEDKPGATDPAWIDLGLISSVAVEKSAEEKEVWAPSPGQLRLNDVIEMKRGVMVTCSCEETSALMFELLFGSLPLSSSSTQYNPLEGTTVKGWMKVQQYDHTDVLINTVDIFTHLKLSGEVAMGDDIVRYDLVGRVLHSTLNTGTL